MKRMYVALLFALVVSGKAQAQFADFGSSIYAVSWDFINTQNALITSQMAAITAQSLMVAPTYNPADPGGYIQAQQAYSAQIQQVQTQQTTSSYYASVAAAQRQQQIQATQNAQIAALDQLFMPTGRYYFTGFASSDSGGGEDRAYSSGTTGGYDQYGNYYEPGTYVSEAMQLSQSDTFVDYSIYGTEDYVTLYDPSSGASYAGKFENRVTPSGPPRIPPLPEPEADLSSNYAQQTLNQHLPLPPMEVRPPSVEQLPADAGYDFYGYLQYMYVPNTYVDPVFGQSLDQYLSGISRGPIDQGNSNSWDYNLYDDPTQGRTN